MLFIFNKSIDGFVLHFAPSANGIDFIESFIASILGGGASELQEANNSDKAIMTFFIMRPRWFKN